MIVYGRITGGQGEGGFIQIILLHIDTTFQSRCAESEISLFLFAQLVKQRHPFKVKEAFHFERVFLWSLFMCIFCIALITRVLLMYMVLLAYTLPISRVITRLYNLIKKEEKNGFVFNWIRDLPVERLGLLLAVLQMYQLV